MLVSVVDWNLMLRRPVTYDGIV